MKEYFVQIRYSGTESYNLKAENPEEAEQIALRLTKLDLSVIDDFYIVEESQNEPD